MGSGLSNSSIRHTVQFQKSSIHNTNTPGDLTTNTSGTFFSTTSPSKNTMGSGRTSFQTSTTFDPTSITPNTNSSSLMVPRTPLFKSSGNNDMIQQSMNVNSNGNSFMQFNKQDPSNPNSKDFSYMLFNIKVFRTPKEQSWFVFFLTIFLISYCYYYNLFIFYFVIFWLNLYLLFYKFK